MKTYDFVLVNADTDSITINKKDGSSFSEQEKLNLISELNSLYPEEINWEDDGYYKKVVVLKAKNYIMVDHKDKVKLKGSSLKSSKTEPAMKEMLNEMIDAIVNDKEDDLKNIYTKYILEATKPSDLMRWASKKNVTKAVMNCAKNPLSRKQEMDIWNAIKNKNPSEGDKFYVIPCIIEKKIETVLIRGKEKQKVTEIIGLKCIDDCTENDLAIDRLLSRCIDTVKILSNVVDSNTFIDYTLVRNKPLLAEIVDEKM